MGKLRSGLLPIEGLLRSQEGSMAMMTALVTPVLLMGAGLAIDISNMTALKTRFQSASDSVSLAVASRIANGDLSIANAESFGSALLLAQMESDDARFSNLTVTPTVEVTETSIGINKTWNVKIGGTASQDTTPFAGFFGKDRMDVSTSASAVTGTEEIQGALSMAVVVDVSGSMGWELDPTSPEYLSETLGLTTAQSNKVSTKMNEAAAYPYYLTAENMTYILENFVFDDCGSMGNNKTDRIAFLTAIGMSTNTSKYDTKQMCKLTTFSSKNGWISQQTAIDNVQTLVSVAHPQIKIDALKQALGELFTQFSTADPTQSYVRTGLSAYAYGVRGDTDLEWGTSSASNYASAMYASGGTASTNSVKWAYNELKNSNATEATEHYNKNGQTPDRFILFMTDGDNNYSSDDTSTKSYCDQAKADNITIFSVAFAAPEGGQELLSYCASSEDNYYEPETASELITAFKNIGVSSTKTLTRLTQ
ncbi:TadE/TadG family type IV pilus assembly protein [Lentilitoribacter sp. EG35]|uniref:TadE/TadG family type IV pilus assembly protein n=1 Tax=Lentilitoribacter sp. EG35 TaxID=3234192 RepID=UPI00345FB93E